MTYRMSAHEVTVLAGEVTGAPALTRDHGLIEAACARPAATAFGAPAYPDPWLRAAALLHSLARNHPLVDGNKRTAIVAAWYLLACEGVPVPRALPVDDAERLIVDVAAGRLGDVPAIAAGLRCLAVTA